MHEPIETSATIVWMEEGTLHIRSKGIASTRESVLETFRAVEALIGDDPRPVLFDARAWPSGTPEAWVTVIERMQASFSAVAMLIEPDSPTDVGEYPAAIDRMLVPFRLFTSEAEARAFLR